MNKRQHDDGTLGSKIYAGCLYSCLFIYTLVFLFGKWFLPSEEKWCPYARSSSPIPMHHYSNIDYNNHPCQRYRTPYLLFLHLQEVEFAQRMIFSVILGGIIGFERRASERPAGIRTMCMVCLGSCFFSMCGQLAFKSSTMGWDAARVAAAVPSGVGFLGAGLIWKGSTTSVKNIDGEEVKTSSQEVHGLTTAASVWLSAAVGVAVSGGRRLYIVSIYGVMLVILVLRFGPQIYFAKDSDSQMDFDDEVDSEMDWGSEISSDLSHMDSDDDNYLDSPVGDDVKQSTTWESENVVQSPASNGVDVQKEAEPLLNHQRNSSSLSRHLSAPDIMMMTYEVPIVDHSREKSKRAKPRRDPNKNRKGNMRLSFHG